MKSFNLILLLLWLPVILLAKSGDSTNIQVLSPEQMKEDLKFFYDKIEKTHPNPYQVLTPEQYEHKKQELLNSLKQPMNVYDFWKTIAQVHPFFDAHTLISPHDDIGQYLLDHQCLYFYSGAVFAVNDSLYFGAFEGMPDSLKYRRMLKINMLPIDSIIRNISNYITNESQIAKNKWISNWCLAILYPLLYDMPKQINIEYMDNDIIKNVLLTTYDFNRWDSIYRNNNTDISTSKPFTFKYNPQDKIAIFEINTFSGDFEAYNVAIINAIDSLHFYDIQHLFLDISRNGGGSDKYVFLLLNYMNFPEWATPAWKDYTYHNKLYLIQSNYTFSAATTLSSYFKHYRLGTIIGEEAGGLTASYTDATTSKLPHSKLTMYCATKAVVDVGGQWDGHGVLPDIEYPVRGIYQLRSFTWKELKEMVELTSNE
jgi:hypothetical protein